MTTPAGSRGEHLSLREGLRQLGIGGDIDVEPRDRTVLANGVRLHYLDWGNESAPPMAFVHGGSSHAHFWHFAAPAFATAYHVIAPDLRGHGDSGWALDGDYGRSAHTADLGALFTEERLAPMVLVGHSMGANIALRYAGEHPEDIRALVMVDSGPSLPDEADERPARVAPNNQPAAEGSFESFVDRIGRYSSYWPAWQVRLEAQHSVRPLPDGQWTWKGDHLLRDPEKREQRRRQADVQELWACWERLRCPTLLVRGAMSRLFPIEAANRLIQRLPTARFVEVPAAGHRVPQDNPADFVRVLEQFLSTALTEGFFVLSAEKDPPPTRYRFFGPEASK